MPNLFFALSFFVFGLVFGSFANVLILRDDRRKSILTGRSACPHCGHPLSWYELLPILSFVMQGGRCRSCRAAISPQYPAIELAGGLLFWLSWNLGGGSVLLASALSIAFLLLLVVAVIDIRTMYVPVEYVVAAGLIGAAGMLGAHQLTWMQAGQGILAGAGTLAAVMLSWKLLFDQDGMGSGDIWTGGALGAIAGYPLAWVALAAAVFSGAAIGVLSIPFAKKGLQSAIPFGPFLFVGLLIAMVAGQAIVRWYTLYV